MKTDPAAALQHTRCIQALTAIGVCIDSSVIDVSGLGALEKQIAKVKRWRDAAAEITTKHRKLSAGARRDLDAIYTLSRQLEALDPAVAVHGTAIYADIAPRDGAFL